MRSLLIFVCVLSLATLATWPAFAQNYAVGADVSFFAKCEQDGVVFKENGKPVDVLAILRAHHYNWVRLRLFHNPAAAPVKLPNDLPYTLALAHRAKAMGFRILLDLHYSDSWADPAKQPTPAAWSTLNHKQLVKHVYAYTRDTIATFAQQGVMPDMVQVGNEIINGMLWTDGKLTGTQRRLRCRRCLLRPAPCPQSEVRRHRPLLLSVLARRFAHHAKQSAEACVALSPSHHRGRNRIQLDAGPGRRQKPGFP
jgi:hypothetical protein